MNRAVVAITVGAAVGTAAGLAAVYVYLALGVLPGDGPEVGW